MPRHHSRPGRTNKENHPVSFILRILFTGLIAFVPNADHTEMTVLLLNADHYHTSDGAFLATHKPLLLARAGSCSGQCPTTDADIAKYVYADKSDSEGLDALEAAVAGGGAWDLTGSDLSLQKGSSGDPDLPALNVVQNVRGTVDGQPLPIPTTAAEREDFSWVADLKPVCPSPCPVNSDILGDASPTGLIAARLRLHSGNVFTYSVARIGIKGTPLHFRRLDGEGDPSASSPTVASWDGAGIEVSGDRIEIVH